MQEQKPSKKPLIYYIIVASLILLLLNAFVFPPLMEVQVTQVTYSDFIAMVDEGRVKELARDNESQVYVFSAEDDEGGCATIRPASGRTIRCRPASTARGCSTAHPSRRSPRRCCPFC